VISLAAFSWQSKLQTRDGPFSELFEIAGWKSLPPGWFLQHLTG